MQNDEQRYIGSWHNMLISDPRLSNPHPDKLIATLDLETAPNTWSVPVFFAITAEPVIAAANSGSNKEKGGVK